MKHLIVLPGMSLALWGIFQQSQGQEALVKNLLQLDLLAISMLVFTSLLSWILFPIAERQLARTQSNFKLHWAALVLLIQSTLIADNLILLTGGLLASSWALTSLLAAVPDRVGTSKVASSYLKVALIGDTLFLIGAVLLYLGSSKLGLQEIFMAPSNTFIQIGLFAFALGGMVKSVQFPFHGWLTRTLENPTAVSALMHAGVVNVGGFILLRFAPMISTNHPLLFVVLAIGLITIVLGGATMMTQTDVKRRLAWSTVAQMGFLFVEFALGLYPLVLLHLMGHGIYKAHGFIFSGEPEIKRDQLWQSQPLKLFATWTIIGLMLAAWLPQNFLSFGAMWVLLQSLFWLGFYKTGVDQKGVILWIVGILLATIMVPILWSYLLPLGGRELNHLGEVIALNILGVLGLIALRPQSLLKSQFFTNLYLQTLSKSKA